MKEATPKAVASPSATPTGRPARGNRNRLRKELHHDVPPPCPGRSSDTDLAGALKDRGQQDVHDADAADQEGDAGDRSHQEFEHQHALLRLPQSVAAVGQRQPVRISGREGAHPGGCPRDDLGGGFKGGSPEQERGEGTAKGRCHQSSEACLRNPRDHLGVVRLGRHADDLHRRAFQRDPTAQRTRVVRAAGQSASQGHADHADGTAIPDLLNREPSSREERVLLHDWRSGLE